MRHNSSGRLLHQVKIEFASYFNPNSVEAWGNLLDVILYMFSKLSIFIYICIQYKGQVKNLKVVKDQAGSINFMALGL